MIEKDIFIGICYHKTAPIIKTEILQPIQVGAALTKSKLDFAIPDDTGTNISDRNKKWCEITALYWMRHNVDAECYGLMHYRRLLSFSLKLKTGRSFVSADTDDYRRFGWDDQNIRDIVISADIVTSRTFNVHPIGLSRNVMTNYNMYARDHFIEDLDTCIAVCRDVNKDIFPYFLQALKGTETRFSNIFVMKRDLFFEYTDWMVGVLEETERRLDTSQYDTYQYRVMGFLAERLTEAYFRYAQLAKDARICEQPVAFAAKAPHLARVPEAISIAKMRAAERLDAPKAQLEPINITFAIDEEYAQHAATSLHSVLLNTKTPGRYHFYIVHNGDITDASRQKTEQVAKGFGAQISFVEVSVNSLRWLPMNRAHISLTTYYRLIMHKYLPADVHKIIYLDADTLAAEALEELWDTNLNGNMIAAAADEGGVIQSRRLRLSAAHKYFNAGVLVLDMDKLRQKDLSDLVLNAFEDRGEYVTLQDQDLLNIVFENRTTPLDLKWNVNNRIFVKNELDPAYSDNQANAAAQNPGVLHFTDSRKPWHHNCYNPYYDLYWFHRNQTPWAETSAETFKRRLVRWIWCHLNSKYRRNFDNARVAGTGTGVD